MFYNQRYIGDYIIQRFQREYLERCEDRKSYNYLASRHFRFVSHRRTDNATFRHYLFSCITFLVYGGHHVSYPATWVDGSLVWLLVFLNCNLDYTQGWANGIHITRHLLHLSIDNYRVHWDEDWCSTLQNATYRNAGCIKLTVTQSIPQGR